jgi:hypothetical protein
MGDKTRASAVIARGGTANAMPSWKRWRHLECPCRGSASRCAEWPDHRVLKCRHAPLKTMSETDWTPEKKAIAAAQLRH